MQETGQREGVRMSVRGTQDAIMRAITLLHERYEIV
jgi:hypothetical protein